MTNEMTYLVDIVRAPRPVLLFCSWTVSGLTALITIPLAIACVRSGKTVFRIIAMNRVVALATSIACLCGLSAQLNSILLMQGMMVPGEAAMVVKMRGLSSLLNQVSISVLLSGLNALTATTLSQKWNEPQPQAATSRDTAP